MSGTSFAGSGAGLFGLDASNFSSGTLPDARLSSNVPRLGAANAFGNFTNSFAGSVGIRTTTPVLPLDVNGAARINGPIQSSLTPITTTSDLGLYSGTSGVWLRMVSNNAPILFFTNYAVGTGAVGGSPALVITSGGNVGIGTDAPTTRLTVAGNANVTGTLAKGGGSFLIDHPLDPENKYLYHSFVESPDMMNVYNGNAVTDAAGYATITLPDYFEALNREYRYQLTVVDDGERLHDFVLTRVVAKISENQFTIKSSVPGVEVSWQVTGIRKDAFAEKNRIPNTVDKPAHEKGTYLHPEAFGKPAERGLHAPSGAGY